MSLFHSAALAGASGKGGASAQYQVARSLRFNSADSANLSRVIASAGNRKTWTWSGWVKCSAFGALNILFSSGADGSNNLRVGFDASDKLFVSNEAAGVTTTLRLTTAVYRDPGAWMHIVLALDTTLATAADRVKLYVNGAQVTAFDTNNAPTQNADLNCNNVGTFYIGRNFASNYLNAYLADVHFVSGSALTPSSFGETDSITGQWVRKAFTGSYGTNGHRLFFSDNSAATAAALGADTSGGGNNFTPNNLSVTTGFGNDSVVDLPASYGTDTGVGGEVRGNYATFNPLDQSGTNTFSNGNLDISVAPDSGTPPTVACGSISVSSGKWYWEVTPTAMTSGGGMIGVGDFRQSPASRGWQASGGWYYYGNSGHRYNNNSSSAYGAAYANNDVIGIALDLDAGTLVFYKNGASQGTAYNTGLTGKLIGPVLANGTGGGSQAYSANFGQRPFIYPAPSGFKALCDTNLPAPTIARPSTVMDMVLYTGTGASLTPTSSLGFSPDLVWVKSRSTATDNTLYDTARGAQARLESNNTDAEVTTDGGLTAFNSNGFTLGTLAQVNTSTATYAAWCWDAGSSTVTNNDGTVSSQVRANTSAGFSIATFTTPATNGSFSVGHGLGVKPSMTILKARSTGDSWFTWHIGLGDNLTDYLTLAGTAPKSTQSGMWGTVGRTSTVCGFASVISTFASTNYVMYNFTPVAGYSAFGSYTGNGSADGPFVYTGFRPRWVLVKSASSGNWALFDTGRLAYNVSNSVLYPNLTNAEDNGSPDRQVDILSNGFKVRCNNVGSSDVNGASATHVYCAFAEFPFQYARAR